MPLNGKFLDKSGLTYLWSKLKDLFSGKVDKETGKGLSTNDYTTSEKTKLSGIETGANKTVVDSAMSSSSTNPVQNKIIKDALDGKQNTLTFDSTPTQSSTNPVTSGGVYTDQQRQETEIGVVANAGAKNYCPKETETSTSSGFTSDVPVNIPAGTYILSFTGTLAYTASLSFYRALPHSGNVLTSLNLSAQTGTQYVEFTIAEAAKYIAFYHNGSGDSLTNIMIRPASITDNTFVPYSKTNRELTVAEDEDRAALVQQIDGGAKNLCNWIATSSTISGVTFTINSDRTVSTSGTATARSQKALEFKVPSTFKAGRYVLSGCPTGGKQSETILYCLYIWDQTANVRVCSNDTGNGIEFDWIPDASHTYSITVDVRSGSSADGLTFKPMICTAADYTVSTAFVPYRPSWQEMWEMIQALQNNS